MFDKNFTPPKPHITQRETSKRIKIVEEIAEILTNCSNAVILTGSMAYGQDFSVGPDSDIDLQVMTNASLIEKIDSCKFFQKYNTERIKEGFLKGAFTQFSIQAIYREVKIELHFWDEKTYREILQLKHQKITRMQGQKKKTSTDYSYSFDGEELEQVFNDYKSDEYNLGEFPVYTEKNGKIFFSRPITNILGNAIVLFDSCDFKNALDSGIELIKQKLEATKKEPEKTYSIWNTLPGKNKVSPEVREMMEQ